MSLVRRSAATLISPLLQSASMVEVDRKTVEGRCQICDSYDLKGTWTCECGGVNVSKLDKCWKCAKPRVTSTSP